MITKEEFQEIRKLIKSKEVYDLMATLRGIDYDYPYLKYLFTARIRYFLGVSKRYAKIRTTKTIFSIEASIILKEIKRARKEHMKRHYFIHINSALGVLRDNKMVDKADKIYAFWNGRSKGTKYVISYSKEKHKNIEVIQV